MPAPSTVSRFRPVHDAHAIVEESIFLEFMPELQQAMPALISLKDELKDEFPASETINVMRMHVVQQQNEAPKFNHQELNEGAGIRLTRFQPDGTPEAGINIDLNTVAISCQKYTRWEEIWPRQKSYIAKVLSRISGTNSFLTGIGMQWVDQFLYEGDDATYDASELLRTDSPHLNQRVLGAGTRWHCHTGWFDSVTNQGRDVLNQINVDAGQVNVAGKVRTAVTISHNQILRVAQRLDELASFNQADDPDHTALSGLMEALHDGNKRVLGELLTESASKRIGLKAG